METSVSGDCSETSASCFANMLGLVQPAHTQPSSSKVQDESALETGPTQLNPHPGSEAQTEPSLLNTKPSSSEAPAGSDLDPEYLSHIHSIVSKTGFTSPQQIYETISSMSKDDSARTLPSVFNMPTNPSIPPLCTSKSASTNQLESFLSIPFLPSSKDRGRRIELTLQEKVDLIKHSEGKSQRALAEIFGVGKSQVNLILKRKNEIINMYAKGGHLERKRLRLHADKDEINSLTLDWFMEEYKNEGVTLTAQVVQDKAKEFAAQLGRTEFRASSGWFHSFCKRNNIGFNSNQGLYIKENTPDLTWPSQVMIGNEGWMEGHGFDLGQEQGGAEESTQSDAFEEATTKQFTNLKKESLEIPEPSMPLTESTKPSPSSSSKTTPPPAKKFKRCELNLLEKVELLQQHSAGKPERVLSKMFGVGRSQVYSTLKRKAEILEAYERIGNTNRKRLHSRGETDEINQLTWHWFKEITKMKSVTISGPMLQAKAKEFANQLGRNDFKASNGWLDTFRKRHYIKFTTAHGFVYDPPENIPLESFFPVDQQEPEKKKGTNPKLKGVKVAKRVDLTLQEKVLLIEQSEGKSQRQLATLFGVGKSQVHSILRRKDEILEAFTTSGKGSMKRMNNRAETDDVNRLTWEWFQEVFASSETQITGVIIQTKARDLAKQMGREDFKASNGWLDSFKKRNNIVTNDQKFLVICDEKDILCWKESLSDYMKTHNANDILCVSEISLYYTSMPERILNSAKYQIKKKTQSQSVSVVLCSNILGEFQTPLVIGKQCPDKPTLEIPPDLPVEWRWNSTSWASVEFFTDWVVSLDQKMGDQGRKVVLFLDRAPPDATEILLENVQLVCPPTYSPRLQPLSHGAIEAFKHNYLKQMLSALVQQTVNTNENISKVLKFVSVLDACSWIHKAVKDIDPDTVTRAFFECGFKLDYKPKGIPESQLDGEYELLIKKVIESFARKPLSYYMGTMPDEPPSSESSQNVAITPSRSKCRKTTTRNSRENVSVLALASSDGSSHSKNSSENSQEEEEGEEAIHEQDPSVDFSLDKFSPLGRSLYTSSRRATLEKNRHLAEISTEGGNAASHASGFEKTLSQIETEDVSPSMSEDADDGSGDSVNQTPRLRTREDALMAAESLRQYCLHNSLVHIIGNIETVINAL